MSASWWAVLADPPPEKVTPGVLGFTVMFCLALATFVLIRSMVGHLRKVRYGPGGPDGPPLDGDRPAPSAGDGTPGPAPAVGPAAQPPTDQAGSATGQVKHE